MSALLTLTRREIADRKPLLWGTLVAALIPILARLQPWLRPDLRRDIHESLALIFGITFPIALALGLGASVVGEDLAQRRLGFYFSRPVRGWMIWASKTLAATLITLATFAAFVIPVVALSDGRWSAVLADLVRKFPGWVLPWIAGLLALIFVAQAVAGAYRARDGLFALDIVALATLVTLAAALGWRLYAAGAATLAYMVLPAIVLVSLAAAVAGAMQVIVGRTDARRGHLALSTTLWGTLAASLLGAAGFSSWVLSVSPQDVGAYPWSVQTTASASHLAFWAARPRAGYQPMFLLETATGRFDRLPWNRVLGFAFSRDGSRAVWIEGGEGEVPELVLRPLDVLGSSTIRSSLGRYAGVDPQLARLSDDGREAVLATRTRIAIVDTYSGREVASASGGQLGVDARSAVLHSRCAFVGDAVVGFFVPPPSAGLPLVISTFDFRTGRVAAGPRVEGIEWVRTVRDGRALVSGRNGPLAVVDASSVLQLVPAENGTVVGSATLLDEGRAAAFVNRGGDRRLMVWNHEGRTTLDVPMPAGTSFLAGEPRAGWLALGVDFSKPPRTVFVDSTTGAVVREEEGLTPAAAWNESGTLPAGSPGSQVFVGTKGEIVRLDPVTGRRETILVSAAPESARYR